MADALGLHLDSFQRIAIDPCSVSVVRYTDLRPFVLRVERHRRRRRGLVPPPAKKRSVAVARGRSSDAVVGGGAGAEAPG